jgi:hypothetical protein
LDVVASKPQQSRVGDKVAGLLLSAHSYEPNFAKPERDGSLVRKVKQGYSIALSLCIGFHSYAVNQQMICPLFEDRDPCRLTFNF